MEISVFYDHILEAAHQSGKSTLEILKHCHDIGIRGLETNFSFLAENKSSFGAELLESKMKISCIYEGFDLAKSNDTSRGKHMIDTAEEMGSQRVLIIPGELEGWEAAELSACSGDYDATEQYMNQSAAIQNMRSALTELVEYAAKANIQITLEDYDGFLQPFARTNQLLWFMRHVTGLKFTLDTGNFSFSDEDVEAAEAVLEEYIVHVHCKDRKADPKVGGEFCKGLGQCSAGQGYIPLEKLIARLKERGYNGYLAIEHFGAENQIAHIEASAECLKKFISAQ